MPVKCVRVSMADEPRLTISNDAPATRLASAIRSPLAARAGWAAACGFVALGFISHSLWRFDAQKAQSVPQDSPHQVRQAQPRAANNITVSLEDRTVLVERAVSVGEFMQIAAQPVRLERAADIGHNRSISQQSQRQAPLGGFHDARLCLSSFIKANSRSRED